MEIEQALPEIRVGSTKHRLSSSLLAPKDGVSPDEDERWVRDRYDSVYEAPQRITGGS